MRCLSLIVYPLIFSVLFFSCGHEQQGNGADSGTADRPIPLQRSVMSLEDIPEGKREVPLWLRYPALSPDGRYIAFNYKGRIWKVASDGGTAVPLTTGDHYEFRPIWSPDGKKIAFSSDRTGNFDVFVINADGGAVTRVTWHSARDYPEAFLDADTVLFSSARKDPVKSSQFPSRALTELYAADLTGSDVNMLLHVPAERVSVDKDGSVLYYHDRKGYENRWRKHHTSSVTRDIWKYTRDDDTFTRLTTFSGEDRDPEFHNGTLYYISEKSGSFNVWKMTADKDADTGFSKPAQVTSFTRHPVRSLSLSDAEKLCFSFHGEIYTMKAEEKPEKLSVFLPTENTSSDFYRDTNTDPISEFVISPSGSEVVFILHGDIFAASLETGTTTRITETPGEERSVLFGDNQKTLLYAGERNGSWNIYRRTINDDAEQFFRATDTTETPVVENDHDTFQPLLSPDGRQLVYMRNRRELLLRDMLGGTKRVIVPEGEFLTYLDGDVRYEISPDSRMLAVDTFHDNRWVGEITLVDLTTGELTNVTRSGYENYRPVWMKNGAAVAYFNTRDGNKQVYGFFLNRKKLNEFLLSKEEHTIRYGEKEKKPGQKGDAPTPEKKKKIAPVPFETDGLRDRARALTVQPRDYLTYTFSADSEKLYALANAGTSFDLWEVTLREKKERLVLSIPHPPGLSWFWKPPFELMFSADGKKLLGLINNKLYELDIAKGVPKPVKYRAEFSVDRYEERAYLFEHVWSTLNSKFYEKTMHGIDWERYGNEYRVFLPHINNNYDFTEMLSEMLGELNASHTGSGFIHRPSHGDSTGHIGVLFDSSYSGTGLKIAEVLDESPLMRADSSVGAGTVITSVNGTPVATQREFTRAMNRTVGHYIGITVRAGGTGRERVVRLKPVGYRPFYKLMYNRWVQRNRRRVEKLSNGRLGYVHVAGMNQESFRDVYGDILGRYNNREGIIVDTRFNGGGWLHNDLAILLSGRKYTSFSHRDITNLGGDPLPQWTKPSVLVVNEGNYSDAHFFAYAYRALGIGEIVGMPVAGTSTAVWWPQMLDRSMYFGIPQIGVRDVDGDILENKELIPDHIVENMPSDYSDGRDRQLEKAVDVLLSDIEKKKKQPAPADGKQGDGKTETNQ